MLGVGLIVTGIVAAGVFAAFWNDIKKFLIKAIRKVEQIISGVVYGSKVFLKKLSEGFKEISRHYSQNNGVWEETTVTRTVSASEVPEEFRRRAAYANELDITDEFELALS